MMKCKKDRKGVAMHSACSDLDLKLDVDHQWDDDASRTLSYRMKIKWCKLVEK